MKALFKRLANRLGKKKEDRTILKLLQNPEYNKLHTELALIEIR